MTISNTKAKSVYETNGERREWEIGFDFDSNVSKLNIILEDSEGYQTIVEDNYLIEDGVVIYPSLESELDPIAEGYKIILFRSTPNTQDIDLRDNVTEKGLDKLTLQVQELSEQVDRAVKVPLVEEGVNEYQDLVLKVREKRDSALEQIKEATSVVSDYTQESALNAVTSKEEADRAVEASNVSVMASSDAEAFATKAENLANEAHNAVSAYVNGLGAMRNAVLDLGVFEDNQRRASSSIIDFDFEPLDVFVRFSDSEKKMWIKGSHSFAGIEKVGDNKYKIFYSVSPEDFASQGAIKGPFYVQYVIKYSVFSGKPVIYRGRVDTVDQLPETAEDGDLWYVGPVEQSNKEEYIWQDGKWELLGSTDFTNIYTKEEIDNKVKVIEADIDANADAILKTRGDFMESDSELQQQINAHAEELTTQRNDIDGLGDQVAGIEGKIPETATDANPLVTKQDLLDAEMNIRDDVDTKDGELQEQLNAQATAIAGKQDTLTAGEGISIDGNVISATGGGGEVPDNVYTETNLLAGKDIEIVKKSGGIDENTVACWHFDNDGLDAVSGLEYPYVTVSNTVYKLGTGSCSANSGNNNGYDLLADSNSDFTIEGYFKAVSANEYAGLGFTLGKGPYYTSTNNIDGANVRVTNSGIFLRDSYQGAYDEYTISTLYADWFHLVLQRKGSVLQVFLNGAKILERAVSSNGTAGAFTFRPIGAVNTYMDEVRISKVARYDGDFEPPTVPYEAGSAGSVINFTGEAGQSGKNIGEVYYSQSSLASDNAGALPLFTGETIASANTIYPDFYSWVESHTELQTTAEEYESALTTYGECPKYVLSDGSLRLPKLANYIKMANTTDGITQSEAGLPNITGQVGIVMYYDAVGQPSGAFYNAASTVLPVSGAGASGRTQFDASLSSEVYGKSDTVTPAHTTLFPWVFAYNATVPASTAQAAEFQQGLSGKADADLDNTIPSKTFRENVFNWGLPDYTAGVSKTWNTDITAETNGWVRLTARLNDDAASLEMTINGTNVFHWWYTYDAQGNVSQTIPVGKGDVYKVWGATASQTITFYPCKGEVL